MLLLLSHFSRVRLFGDPIDYSLMGSSVYDIFQQEYWSGLPFPPPGDLPTQGLYARFLLTTDSWLTPANSGCCASTAGGVGPIPDQGTMTPALHGATWLGPQPAWEILGEGDTRVGR